MIKSFEQELKECRELNAELLAALKGVGHCFVNGREVFDGIPLKVREQAEAAIAKAEGRE